MCLAGHSRSSSYCKWSTGAAVFYLRFPAAVAWALARDKLSRDADDASSEHEPLTVDAKEIFGDKSADLMEEKANISAGGGAAETEGDLFSCMKMKRAPCVRIASV